MGLREYHLVAKQQPTCVVVCHIDKVADADAKDTIQISMGPASSMTLAV